MPARLKQRCLAQHVARSIAGNAREGRIDPNDEAGVVEHRCCQAALGDFARQSLVGIRHGARTFGDHLLLLCNETLKQLHVAASARQQQMQHNYGHQSVDGAGMDNFSVTNFQQMCDWHVDGNAAAGLPRHITLFPVASQARLCNLEGAM